MNTRRIAAKIGMVLLILCTFFTNSALLLADSQVPSQTQQSSVAPDAKALRRIRFLQSIRDEIRNTQKDYQAASRTAQDDTVRLAEVQQKVTTLKDQVDNLDSQISDTEAMILNVKAQIGEKENKLMLLNNEADMKRAALDNEKQMLVEYLKTLYEQESGITDTTGSNEDINIAKLLLSDETVGDQLQQLQYFKILENTGHEIFDRLQNMLNDIQASEQAIADEKDKLAGLYVQLADEKQTLEMQRNAKSTLLEETKGDEKIYQQLADQSKRQEEEVQSDLDTLQANLTYIKNKIRELGDSFNPEEYFSLLTPESTSIYKYLNEADNAGVPVFHWPVSPSSGISAYFHDPSYVAVFGFIHNAIDIRAPQGSLVRAPADGVVYKVRDNGYGYSYLILAHKGGFMTVYGHISEFKVEEGERVFTGQVLAYSGGTPGTKGAGLMTTGPHLHFEMMKDGKYVDPLDYLPLDYLPLDTLPEKYQSRVTGNKLKVRRVTEDGSVSTQESDLTQMIERNALVEDMAKKALQDQQQPQPASN